MPLRSCSASPAARFALTATVAFLLATLFGPWWFGTDPVQLAGWCLIGGITVALGLWEQRKD